MEEIDISLNDNHMVYVEGAHIRIINLGREINDLFVELRNTAYPLTLDV